MKEDGYYHVYTMTIHHTLKHVPCIFWQLEDNVPTTFKFHFQNTNANILEGFEFFELERNVTLSTAHEVGLLHEHKFFASQRKGFWS